MVLKDGEEFRGAVIRIEGDRVTVQTQAHGQRRLAWDQVRVLERVVRPEAP